MESGRQPLVENTRVRPTRDTAGEDGGERFNWQTVPEGSKRAGIGTRDDGGAGSFLESGQWDTGSSGKEKGWGSHLCNRTAS